MNISNGIVITNLLLFCLVVVSSFNNAYATEKNINNNVPQKSISYTKSIDKGNIDNISYLHVAGNRVVGVANKSNHLTLLNFIMDENENISLLSSQEINHANYVYDISNDGEWLLFSKIVDEESVIGVLRWDEQSSSYKNVSSDSMYSAPSEVFNQTPINFSEDGQYFTANYQASSLDIELAVFHFDVSTGNMSLLKNYTTEDNEIFDDVLNLFWDESNSLIVVPFNGVPAIFEVNLSDYSVELKQTLSAPERVALMASYDSTNNQLFYGGEADYGYYSIDFEAQTNEQLLLESIPHDNGLGCVKLKSGLLARMNTPEFANNSSIVIAQFLDGQYHSIKNLNRYSEVALMDEYIWIEERGSLSVYAIDRSLDNWSLVLKDSLVDGEQNAPSFNEQTLFDEENQLIYSVRTTGLSVHNLVNSNFSFHSWRELGLDFESFQYDDIELTVLNNQLMILFNGENTVLFPYIDEQELLKATIETLYSNQDIESCHYTTRTHSSFFTGRCSLSGGDWGYAVFNMLENNTISYSIFKEDIFSLDNVSYSEVYDFWHNQLCIEVTRHSEREYQQVSLINENNKLSVATTKPVESCGFRTSHRLLKDGLLYQVEFVQNTINFHSLLENGTINLVSSHMLSSDHISGSDVQLIDNDLLLFKGSAGRNEKGELVNTLKLFHIAPQTLELNETDIKDSLQQREQVNLIQSFTGTINRTVLIDHSEQLDVFQVEDLDGMVEVPTILVLNEGADTINLLQWLTMLEGSAPFEFSSNNMPSGLSLSSEGMLSFDRPTFTTGLFTISVEDSSQQPQEFSINYFFNYRPQVSLHSVIWQNPNQDIAVDLKAYVSDEEEHRLTFSSDSLADGLVISDEGVLTGNLSRAGQYENSIIVMDELGAITSFTATIRINNAPSHEEIPTLIGVMEQGINFNLSTYFYDKDTHSLTYSSTSLPSGLTLSIDGLLSGSINTAGSYDFTLTVTDELGLTIEKRLSLVINEKTVSGNDTNVVSSNSSSGGSIHYLLMLIVIVALMRISATSQARYKKCIS